MGFIGYLVRRETGSGGPHGDLVRIFLECREDSEAADAASDVVSHPDAEISYTYAVDVIFPAGMAECRFQGVDDVFALKKFYKLVNSLEERARAHGDARQNVLVSAANLVKYLGYTRNARDFTALKEPVRLSAALGAKKRSEITQREAYAALPISVFDQSSLVLNFPPMLTFVTFILVTLVVRK